MTLRGILPEDILTHIRKEGHSGDVGVASIRYRQSEELVQVTGVTDPMASEELTQTKQSQVQEQLISSRLYTASSLEPNGRVIYEVGDSNAASTKLSGGGALKDARLSIPINEGVPTILTDNKTVDAEIIPVDERVFGRVSDVVDTDYLADATVAIIGLGTGGSTVATELSKCGVGNFHLYDPDELEIHNVSRHVSGLADVGRKKVYVVRDALKQRNPAVNVTVHPVDILDERLMLREGIQAADCVLACTDTQLSRGVINEEAVAARTPVIYAGAYERAYGGDIIRYDPDKGTPCHACIHGTPDPLEGTPRNEDGSFDYSSASDIESTDFAAEPGLSVDVGFIALIQTRYALATLAQTANADLPDLPHDISIWGNRAREEFDKPFQHRWVSHKRESDCSVCGPEGTAECLRESLSEETTNTAEDVLSDVTKMNDLDVDINDSG